MIKFGLFKHHISSKPGEYKAVIQNLELCDEDDLLEEMIVPGGVTATQASAVLTAYEGAIVKILKSGRGVKTRLFEIKPSVRGIFAGIDAMFDPNHHFVTFTISAREFLRNMAKGLNVQKVTVGERVPRLHRFIDTASQLRNEVLSSGKVGELVGDLLKCDPEDMEQGVFIGQGDGNEIRCANFIHNTSSRLIFFLPDTLESGDEVGLEVRNKLNGRVKAVRVGRFAKSLKVI